MSELQYENFLIDILSSWIRDENAAPGRRYHYQFPNSEDSVKLYSALLKAAPKAFQYEETQLRYLEIEGLRILFVRHSDSASGEGDDISFSESYISMLRDQVASQAGQFESTLL